MYEMFLTTVFLATFAYSSSKFSKSKLWIDTQGLFVFFLFLWEKAWCCLIESLFQLVIGSLYSVTFINFQVLKPIGEFQLEFIPNSIISCRSFIVIHWNVWIFLGGKEAEFQSSCKNAMVWINFHSVVAAKVLKWIDPISSKYHMI